VKEKEQAYAGVEEEETSPVEERTTTGVIEPSPSAKILRLSFS
jgi:hypothetical protein